MTDAVVDPPKPKSSKLPLLVGLLLALVGGGAGFVFMSQPQAPEVTEEKTVTDVQMDASVKGVEFVPLEPLLITPPAIGGKILRFTAQLEVKPEYRGEVEQLTPRIVDVFNTYLRAIEPSDFEKPEVLILLRGHLLRRIALVVGEGKVTDVLIMEFVLN